MSSGLVTILGLGLSLLAFAFYAAALIGAGLLLQKQGWLKGWSLPWILVAMHGVILVALMALYPFLISERPADYLYGPYMFVLGLHLLVPGDMLAQALFPRLLKSVSYHRASILCIVFVPGIVGLVSGALQWYWVGRWIQTRLPFSLNRLLK